MFILGQSDYERKWSHEWWPWGCNFGVYLTHFIHKLAAKYMLIFTFISPTFIFHCKWAKHFFSVIQCNNQLETHSRHVIRPSIRPNTFCIFNAGLLTTNELLEAFKSFLYNSLYIFLSQSNWQIQWLSNVVCLSAEITQKPRFCLIHIGWAVPLNSYIYAFPSLYQLTGKYSWSEKSVAMIKTNSTPWRFVLSIITHEFLLVLQLVKTNKNILWEL